MTNEEFRTVLDEIGGVLNTRWHDWGRAVYLLNEIETICERARAKLEADATENCR